MKKELLSPAGNMECLIAAVHAGADAIYIGGKKFGARKFANNFDDDEIENAVKYCHLYGVKLYVTVNTIIYETELDDALKYVGFLHKIGIDALIVQDIGLIRSIREMYPNMDVHASTQCHNYNQEQFDIMESIGVSRVVLARELTLEEINGINTKLEKEVFIHGALCISYSGQCLASSVIMGRSGNRGECAGICRLPYDLVDESGNVQNEDNKYILSTKELSTIDNFKELMESDITCFKIEGRMKSPEYVFLATRIYRTLIDQYYNNEEMKIEENTINELKTIFNREFTNGHLMKSRGKDLMNPKTPNNIGIHLGNVTDINSRYITIKLDEDVYQEDGIRFVNDEKGLYLNFIYDMHENLINSAKKNEEIMVDNKINLHNLGEVRKTSSKRLNKSTLDYDLKRILVNITCHAIIGKELEIEVSDGDNKIIVTGNIVEEAKNMPIEKERIEEQLKKLGNTPFLAKSVNVTCDGNIFISIKEINELRRLAIEKLKEERENFKKNVIVNKTLDKKINNNNSEKLELSALVRNREQLDECILNNVSNIYITDLNLYNEYKEKCKEVYYRIPRINKVNLKLSNERIMITDLSQLKKYNNNNIVTDYHLNVVNAKYIDYLFDMGVKKVCLSVENTVQSIKNIYKINNYNLEVVIMGRIELMIMNHCILNMNLNNDKFPCNCCSKKYYLKDRNGELFPILADKMNNEILNYKSFILSIPDILELKDVGVKSFRIDFFDEGRNDVKEILEKYKNLLQIN